MNREAFNFHLRRMEVDKEYRRRFLLYAQQAASKFRIPAAKIAFEELTNADPFYWCARRAFKEEYVAWREWCAQGVPVERQYGVRRAPDTHGVSRIEYLPSVNRKHAKRAYRNMPLGDAEFAVPTVPRWDYEQVAKLALSGIRHAFTEKFWAATLQVKRRLVAAAFLALDMPGETLTIPNIDAYADAHRTQVLECMDYLYAKYAKKFGVATPELLAKWAQDTLQYA